LPPRDQQLFRALGYQQLNCRRISEQRSPACHSSDECNQMNAIKSGTCPPEKPRTPTKIPLLGGVALQRRGGYCLDPSAANCAAKLSESSESLSKGDKVENCHL
jgi:hypothetical protein